MRKHKISDFSKITPFQVPEGYFEDLSVQISAAKTEVNKKPSFRWFAKPQLTIATALVCFLALFVFFQYDSTPNWERELTEVQTEDLLLYLSNSDLTEYELLEDYTFQEEKFTAPENLDDIEIDLENLDLLYLNYDIETLEEI